MKTCTDCKETKSLDDFHNLKSSKDGKKSSCKVCNIATRLLYTRLDVKDYVERAKKDLEKHLKELKPMHMLTNKEWLNACRYFETCAVCREKEISTKHYFVPYLLGGTYTYNNIIPTCEECSKKLRNFNSAFELQYKRIRRSVDGFKEYNGFKFIYDYIRRINNEQN